MLWPKKNSHKEFDKKFLRLENFPPPPPPTTFLMVRPFPELLQEKAPWERGWEYLLMKEKDSKVACSRRFIALRHPQGLNTWKRLIPKQKHDRLQLCIKLSEVGSPTT